MIGQSPNPPQAGFPKRPIEKIEDQKIIRFGEAKLRSPARMLPHKTSTNGSISGKRCFTSKFSLLVYITGHFTNQRARTDACPSA